MATAKTTKKATQQYATVKTPGPLGDVVRSHERARKRLEHAWKAAVQARRKAENALTVAQRAESAAALALANFYEDED